MLQTKNILLDWGYPVTSNGEKLRYNCIKILNDIHGPHQFVGLGGSGAMLLGALSSWNVKTNQFILIGEHRKKPHQALRFCNLPIVVVDDHICSNKTIFKIKALLEHHKVDHLVEYVVMNEWKSFPCKESNQQSIELAFPSAKYWIH